MEIRMEISTKACPIRTHYCFAIIAIKICYCYGLVYYSPTATCGLWVCDTYCSASLWHNLNYYALAGCLALLYGYTSCRFPNQADFTTSTEGTTEYHLSVWPHRCCHCEPFPITALWTDRSRISPSPIPSEDERCSSTPSRNRRCDTSAAAVSLLPLGVLTFGVVVAGYSRLASLSVPAPPTYTTPSAPATSV